VSSNDAKFRAILGLSTMSKTSRTNGKAQQTEELLKEKVQQINVALKEAGEPVRVRLNGEVLGLRATSPLKPGKGQGSNQQDIRLGIPSTTEGFKEIKRRAEQLGKELSNNVFNWANWKRDRSLKDEVLPVS
jgi:hypothetical protein